MKGMKVYVLLLVINPTPHDKKVDINESTTVYILIQIKYLL